MEMPREGEKREKIEKGERGRRKREKREKMRERMSDRVSVTEMDACRGKPAGDDDRHQD